MVQLKEAHRTHGYTKLSHDSHPRHPVSQPQDEPGGHKHAAVSVNLGGS